MERHFQIAEFPPDPLPLAGGREPAEVVRVRGVDWSLVEARSQGLDEEVFPVGVPTRRVSLPDVEGGSGEGTVSFRVRSQSEPANFTCALQYGRELRRMSDEFMSSFTPREGLRMSRSAGAMMNHIYRTVTTLLPRSRSSNDQH